MIKAKVIADSKNASGERLTTMVVTFPRFILAELNTHRMMSRNSASSRAIPFEKMLKSVEENPFIPIAWQRDHKGMQGTEYLDVMHSGICVADWLKARDYAVIQAKQLSETDCTKQLCNRLLEPFMWHTVVVSATEWENFFTLRCPQYHYEPTDRTFRSKKDFIRYHNESSEKSDLEWLKMNKGQAEIHMMALAEAMYDAMNESSPKQLKAGEYHIPFGDEIKEPKLFTLMHDKYGEGLPQPEWASKFWTMKAQIATAMLARISYTTVGEEEKEPNYEADIKLHDRLLASGHMSPFEHIATAMTPKEYFVLHTTSNPGELTMEAQQELSKYDGWSGNFKGFKQYRKTLPNENITK